MHPNPNSLVRAVVAGTVLALLFAFSFGGALHSPAPNDLPVGLAGPPPAVTAVADRLEAAAPGAFAVSRFPDEAAARTALLDRTVDGALVLDPAGPRLLVAGALGMVTRNALVEVFSAAAQAGGQRLEVVDLKPLPAGDRAGISAFALVVTVLVPSVAVAVLIALLGRRRSAAARLGAAASAAVLIGALDAWVLIGVHGALAGAYLPVAGVGALLSAAVSLPALGLHRALGRPGLALAALLFVVFGLPATGGAVGPWFIPDSFQLFSPLLPAGEAIAAVRNAAYFDGAATAAPLWSLAAWAAAGALVLLLPGRRAVPAPAAARRPAPVPA